MNNEVWTTKEVALFIRKSEQTIRRMCKEKKLPHKKIGRNLYFNSKKIQEKFLKDEN